MECFRENLESRQFMFDRMKEIINENMQSANDDYVREILERMDHLNIFTKSLKDEVISLTSMNQKLVQDQENQNLKNEALKNVEHEELKKKISEYRE